MELLEYLLQDINNISGSTTSHIYMYRLDNMIDENSIIVTSLDDFKIRMGKDLKKEKLNPFKNNTVWDELLRIEKKWELEEDDYIQITRTTNIKSREVKYGVYKALPEDQTSIEAYMRDVRGHAKDWMEVHRRNGFKWSDFIKYSETNISPTDEPDFEDWRQIICVNSWGHYRLYVRFRYIDDLIKVIKKSKHKALVDPLKDLIKQVDKKDVDDTLIALDCDCRKKHEEFTVTLCELEGVSVQAYLEKRYHRDINYQENIDIDIFDKYINRF